MKTGSDSSKNDLVKLIQDCINSRIKELEIFSINLFCKQYPSAMVQSAEIEDTPHIFVFIICFYRPELLLDASRSCLVRLCLPKFQKAPNSLLV